LLPDSFPAASFLFSVPLQRFNGSMVHVTEGSMSNFLESPQRSTKLKLPSCYLTPILSILSLVRSAIQLRLVMFCPGGSDKLRSR
jgi:hypothetical protein